MWVKLFHLIGRERPPSGRTTDNNVSICDKQFTKETKGTVPLFPSIELSSISASFPLSGISLGDLVLTLVKGNSNLCICWVSNNDSVGPIY